MKTTTPDSSKAEIPSSPWEKILGATPVVLTVIATLLAGLSSGEMTKAQYDRAFAAQLQAKAGDQWNFFQGKKLRSAVQRSSFDQIAAAGAPKPLDPQVLRLAAKESPVAALLESNEGGLILAALGEGALPRRATAAPFSPEVQAALEGLESAQPTDELVRRLGRTSLAQVEAALRQAQENARTFDAVILPINKGIDLLEKQLRASASSTAVTRDLIAARIVYHAQRYDQEAQLNQVIAYLYELQVKQSNLAAERHHHRSQRFFFGMLAAQAGVVISTLAMAARQKNVLWALAAGAGAVAVAFAVYVYVFV